MPIPENVENLHQLSAKNIIYQAICDWIITGVLKPGEKLVDAEVAKRFCVSRTPVREAFQLLEAQKLICVIPGRATIVTDIDKDDIEKCYLPLAEIQALAARIACQKITDEDLTELEKIHETFAEACHSDQANEAIHQDSLFHERILKITGNEYIQDFSHVLILHIQRIKYHYFHCDLPRKVSVTHHREILDCLKKRHADEASNVMRKHWHYVMDRCLQDVMKPETPSDVLASKTD